MESIVPQLSAVVRLKYDPGDHSFLGFDNKDNNKSSVLRARHLLGHDVVVGERWHWLQLQSSPSWGVFGQNGVVELAATVDGPYVYIAVEGRGYIPRCCSREPISTRKRKRWGLRIRSRLPVSSVR